MIGRREPWGMMGLSAAFLISGYAHADQSIPSQSATAIESRLDTVVVTSDSPVNRLAGLLGSQFRYEDAPIDISRINETTLSEPGMKVLSTALSRDAAVNENYATTGYYQNFTVRGLTLNLGSAYRVNGFVVPGEFDIPLDNVNSIEVLKGIGGVFGGQVGPGGTINFVTRRSLNIRTLTTEVTNEGGSLATLDIGKAESDVSALGFRLIATHAELRPSQPKADGHRDLLSFAVDTHPTSNLYVMADVVMQRRSQPAIPGFQLLGGVSLPNLAVRDININQQPWSRPVSNEGVMASVRAEWQLSPTLSVQGGMEKTVAKINDNLATPYGCNTSPKQYFCLNGDYVLYDYHSQEKRESQHLIGQINVLAESGRLRHAFVFGVERIDRRIRQDDFYSTTSYDAVGNALSGNLASTNIPLPAPSGVGVNLPPLREDQSAVFAADNIKIGKFGILASLRAVKLEQSPSGLNEAYLLPQLALTWAYASNQMFYLSNAKGVEFGSVAPLTAANAGVLLPPRETKQIEAGWKYQSPAFGGAATFFRMERPFEFTQPIGPSWAGLGNFVQRGQQVNVGVDMSWHASWNNSFRMDGSQAIIRATATGTGVDAYDDTQLQNVPYFSSFVRASKVLFGIQGLVANVDWTHRGRRNAVRDGTVSVGGYDMFDAGFSWKTNVSGRLATVAIVVRNLTNRQYWRDVGEAYSADLLFPGAGRSAIASLSLDL